MTLLDNIYAEMVSECGLAEQFRLHYPVLFLVNQTFYVIFLLIFYCIILKKQVANKMCSESHCG